MKDNWMESVNASAGWLVTSNNPASSNFFTGRIKSAQRSRQKIKVMADPSAM
jgi:hypothetical protein